MVITGHLQTEI